VAGELLKTRVWENALALMVAAASVLDGEAAIQVLLSLFEEMKIPVYSLAWASLKLLCGDQLSSTSGCLTNSPRSIPLV
jgi:hypothetical protein